MRRLVSYAAMAMVSMAMVAVHAIAIDALAAIIWGFSLGLWCFNAGAEFVTWQERRQ